MACLLRGMDGAETLALTRALIASGDTVRFSGLDRPTVDKHSTGGVADGVTLVFAPLAASLGMAVAKLSGRGWGTPAARWTSWSRSRACTPTSSRKR